MTHVLRVASERQTDDNLLALVGRLCALSDQDDVDGIGIMQRLF